MKINPPAVHLCHGMFLLFLVFLSSLNAQMVNNPDAEDGFIPGWEKDGPTVSLIYKDTLSIPSFAEFNLPVVMKTGHEISAISLGFYYPPELLEIISMELADSASGFNYSDTSGLFILAWSDVYPIVVDDEEAIITFRMKSLDMAGLTGTIKFGIYELSEFANKSAIVIEDVALEVAEIQYLVPDPEDAIGGNFVQVFPNPFNDHTSINFYLQTDSRIKISLFSLTGIELKQMADESYPMGTHQVKLYASDLSKGIYIIKFTVISEGQSRSKLIKIMAINKAGL